MWFELIGIIAMVAFVVGMITVALAATRNREIDY